MIRRKKGVEGENSWIEAEISNDYAQFIVGQTLAETNYFEEASELCYRVLGITSEQAEELFKHHLLLKADQRQTYMKVIQSVNERITQQHTKSEFKELSLEDTRKALLFMAQVRSYSEQTKQTLLKAKKEKQSVGETSESNSTELYLENILKTRAYDLLWLEMQIDKPCLNAAILTHANMKAIKDLLTEIK